MTRTARISTRRHAHDIGYFSREWAGTPVVFTTWEGRRIDGHIAGLNSDNHNQYVVAFPDGTHALADVSEPVEVRNG